ncbi:MAG TPA: carboxypeptidase regulatory-like domain-containing protein [Kofleriaceae bacterium]|nr:carboxypeptidase regulatory-like domain-containing protein [Kofleriaceae bacterium]
MIKLSNILVGAALAFAGGLLVKPPPVLAQSSSTVGSLRGVLRDKATKGPAAGATVVATSPALVGEQIVLTDENGQYFISALPPGVYTLTIYYINTPFSRGNVLIQVGKEAVVNVTVDSSAGGGEVIPIKGSVPIIDQGSTKIGVTVTDDYTHNIPTGRTFGAVLGAVQGSQADAFGTSIAGATSPENVYVIEGLNTTDTGFGGISSNLPNEFVAETEVITGGYNAELGRATGGVVNVVTKSGSNELRGSVFGTIRPGALISPAKVIERQGTSIDNKTDLDYAWDLGAEVGGPILKDRLWFHVGFNPSTQKQTVTRLIQSQVDKDGDGLPDVDPATGFTIREKLAESEIPTQLTTYFYTAKINGAVSQNHQFQISAFGNPQTGATPLGVVRNPAYQKLSTETGAYDIAGKWTSKLGDGKTQIDAVLGLHRQISKLTPAAGQDLPAAQYGFTRSLYDFADLEGAPNVAMCNDTDPNDPYPMIRNCPVLNYVGQGIGFLSSRTNDRSSAVLAVTQRVKAAGYHTFKAGLDAELTTYDAQRGFTGGAFMLRGANTAAGAPGRWQVQQHMRIKRNLTPEELGAPGSVELSQGEILCADDRAVCEVARDGIHADTSNTGFAAFVQDSWQLRPNLTLNAGLRWEQETGHVASALQGQLTPQGEVIPADAYKLTNMLAPRVGFIFDPTQDGKSKVFGHWGRFYESVPLDINVRAFGGEITNVSLLNFNRRTPEAQGYDPSCNVDHMAGSGDLSQILLQCKDRVQQALLGEGTEFVSPGLRGQYTDEVILGTEFQIVPEFKLGLNYIHRAMPRVIEDISTDGGNSYLITNPGEDFSGAAAKQRAEAARLMATGNPDDAALAEVYLNRATQLDAVSRFEKPIRNYDALVLSAVQRPTKRSLLQASYTYSVSKGNYPGLFSTETNQLDPNLTSLYDLPDLMANRYGNLGLDRPHNLKLDGFYQFDLKKAGVLTTGASFRTQSGIAHNALGAHPVYGPGESYLLPRGSFERSPVTAQLDLQVGYGYRFNQHTMFEGFIRVFNVFDTQDELDVDENYTFDNAIPVIGGDARDLAHAKALDAAGFETGSTVTPNQNFGKVNARQAPRTIQLGMRLTF